MDTQLKSNTKIHFTVWNLLKPSSFILEIRKHFLLHSLNCVKLIKQFYSKPYLRLCDFKKRLWIVCQWCDVTVRDIKYFTILLNLQSLISKQLWIGFAFMVKNRGVGVGGGGGASWISRNPLRELSCSKRGSESKGFTNPLSVYTPDADTLGAEGGEGS